MDQYGYWNSPYPKPPNFIPGPRPMFKDRAGFLQDLGLAIKGEAEAIAFYTALLNQAPDELARRNIRHALEDERKHYRMFSDLNYNLTGKNIPVPIPPPPAIPNYREALITAFEDELKAAELYKRMYLNALTAPIRDLMFEIMMDEMEHADRFSLLYAASEEYGETN